MTPSDVREQILEHLRKAGPQDRKSLASNIPADNTAQLSNCLYQLRLDSKIRKNGAGQWALAGDGKKARIVSSAAPRLAAADTTAVEAILIEAERRAQGFLDDYLASVGDPDVIGPLKTMRDQARVALANYRKGRPA